MFVYVADFMTHSCIICLAYGSLFESERFSGTNMFRELVFSNIACTSNWPLCPVYCAATKIKKIPEDQSEELTRTFVFWHFVKDIFLKKTIKAVNL